MAPTIDDIAYRTDTILMGYCLPPTAYCLSRISHWNTIASLTACFISLSDCLTVWLDGWMAVV